MKPLVTICGLGPGGADRVTAGTIEAIEAASVRFLRTTRHPTAGLVPDATSFDEVYERAESFAEVYQAIADAVAGAALAGAERVVYAVPGSPLVLEDSVRRLRADDRIEVEILPALSFLDEAWARLGVDPVEESVRLVDGQQFAVQAAGERGPMLVAHVHAPWVLSDVKLAVDADDDQRAVVLQRLGTPEERVFDVAWSDLDRTVEPDHLTSLYLPEVAVPVAGELARSVALMHRLRRECPWDREQDHDSLRPYLLEEAYEVLDALEALGADAGYDELEEELGDLWFQVLFHAELAGEAGQFTIADVARTMHDKLVRRHPHVFTDLEVSGPEEVVRNWDEIKRDEKRRTSALDGVPMALPALSLTAKLLRRAERAGVGADLGEIGERLHEALGPDLDEDELGRYLLAVVAVAESRDLDAEAALRRAALAARDRFRRSEADGRTPAADWPTG